MLQVQSHPRNLRNHEDPIVWSDGDSKSSVLEAADFQRRFGKDLGSHQRLFAEEQTVRRKVAAAGKAKPAETIELLHELFEEE